eukprot:472019-Rhodomonas_salina.2
MIPRSESVPASIRARARATVTLKHASGSACRARSSLRLSQSSSQSKPDQSSSQSNLKMIRLIPVRLGVSHCFRVNESSAACRIMMADSQNTSARPRES